MSIESLEVRIAKLLSGSCAVAYALASDVDAPTNIGDIISLVGDPDVAEDYNLFGATVGTSDYGMDVKSSELKINQRNAAVFEDIDDITRGLKVAIAEMTPEHWALLEQAAEVETVAAGANTSQQKLVRSGSFTERDRYRVAFIAQRRKSQGIVVEPDGGERGCYVVFGFYSAAITAGSSSTKLEQGALATRDVEFKGFPDAALDAGRDTMFFFEEQAGTISPT